MQNANKTRGIGPLGSSGVVGRWGASSLIDSVQRGTGSYASTVTITAVDTSRSVLLYGGNQFSANNDNKQYWFQRASLTNSTTVTFTLTGGAGINTAGWQVIEFKPGVLKSVQRGTFTLAAGQGSATATITAVNTNKSLLCVLGSSNNDSVTGGYLGGQETTTYTELTNATTVTATRNTAAGAIATVVSYEVWEFF